MVSNDKEYMINGRTLKKLLKTLVFSNNSTKRALQHLEITRENTTDPVRRGSLANGINNKRRTVKGNENILRMYLDPEALGELGIDIEVPVEVSSDA